jgi:hypothetical protein
MILSWVVLLTFCGSGLAEVGRYGNSISTAPHLRYRVLSDTLLGPYTGTAMEFLTTYGQSYRLFDQFFYGAGVQSGRITQTPPSPAPATERLYAKYTPPDYSGFRTWGVASATVRPEYASLKFDYQPRAANEEIMLYNNKFRYGPNIDDRFMWIGFDRDPWSEATEQAPANVFFVGVNTQLPQTHEYKCVFQPPGTATRMESPVVITRNIPDALNRPTLNSIIKCAVPHELVQALPAESTEIVLNLVRTPVHSPEVAVESHWMLQDVRVPRLAAVHRRQFTHTIQTMVEVLNDVMVTEWLVYNILLGFEHFYIYYNAKGTDFNIEHSILRPFLDANIVTLIYFPFLHTVHYNNVQHAALNAFLHNFGRYTTWVGFWDVDEFFLPGPTYVPYQHSPPLPYAAPIIPVITTRLGSSNEPAIMFDTLDMDCAANSTNFYAGGDNIALLPGASTNAEAAREAVTTHCLRTGYYFKELQVGHGKMLVAPGRIEYLASPHRYNHYYTQWTNSNDGLMRHFNRFRNTMGAIKAGVFTEAGISTDTALQTFTLTSLKELLGVTFEAVQ